MTNEELKKKIAELEKSLEAERSKATNMKDRVMAQLDVGINTMDGLTTALNTTAKNISSVMTALRKELIPQGKTIITQRYKDQMMITVMELKVLGWE